MMGISKRLLFCWLSFSIAILISACGNDVYNNQVQHDFSYESTVDNTDEATKLLESNLESAMTTINEERNKMEVKAIYHDTLIDIPNVNNTFIDSVNEIIGNECLIGLELQEALNDSKINKYCSEGYCVQIQYGQPQTYELRGINKAKSLEINKIYLLIDIENNQSLIGIVCDNDTKLYHMSKGAAESIIDCLT